VALTGDSPAPHADRPPFNLIGPEPAAAATHPAARQALAAPAFVQRSVPTVGRPAVAMTMERAAPPVSSGGPATATVLRPLGLQRRPSDAPALVLAAAAPQAALPTPRATPTPAAQRSTSASTPTAPSATSTPAPAPTPVPAPAPPAAPTAEELEELAKQLYDKIRAQLRAELRLDRERYGRVTDLAR
jgi:hypothetical protein